jgi:tetratricopeptide (TPR) repeat protein
MFTRWGCICFFIFISLFVINPAAFPKNGFNVGLYGGAGSVLMTSYNSKIDTANSYNSSIGINSKLKKLDMSVIPELSLGYDFNIPSGNMGIYLNNEDISVQDPGSKAIWQDGTVAQTIKGDFSAIYSAVGTHFSIDYGDRSELSVFLGVDAGVCHYYWNNMYEESIQIDGTSIYKIKKDWQTVVPAADLEVGVNYWILNNIGIGLKGGYRFSSGKVMLKITNISGWTGSLQGEDTVDYSGAYIQAGMLYSFDQPSPVKKIEPDRINDGQFPEISMKLYDEAGQLFEEGLYRQADTKLDEAERLAPQSVQIARLKAKLAEKLKIEKSNENVKKLLKEADSFRQKKDYRKATARYAEIKIIDPENEYASYFIELFKSQAAESMNDAKALKKQGDLKNALEAAQAACGYAPDNAEYADFAKQLRSQSGKNDSKNRVYNEGVEYFKKGDYKKAVDSWQEVINQDPSDKEAAKNLAKAMKKLDEVGIEEKESEEKAATKAEELFLIGKLDEAKKKCEYVLRINPANKDALRIMDEIKKDDEKNRLEIPEKR